MQNTQKIRLWLMLVWLTALTLLWTGFQYAVPITQMRHQLDSIEQSITSNQWQQANDDTAQFIRIYRERRHILQANNATEALTTFEYTLGQLEITVRYKEKSALEFVGALREGLDLVMKPFAGP